MKISKIINKLFTVAILAIVVLVVISIVPIPGNYKLLIVQSGSMEPAIKTGSVVIVKPAESYKAGDIITFSGKEKDKTVTHRIVDLEVVTGKINYITKGDANNSEDSSKTPEEKVIGKVLASIPYLGYLFAAAKEPAGFFLLIIVPCAIIILEEIGKIWKEIKNRKRVPDPEKKESEEGKEKISDKPIL